jgi:hypothetical protein
MGGLLSAYYLSGGDELFLAKAVALGDRLMPAFNTSSGLPITKVTLKGTAAARAAMGPSDGQTNLAEAATLSMEFTALGRLTGRSDFFDVGMVGWHALMGARNISGLYCVGLSTQRGDCYLHKLSVGSAADSMCVFWGVFGCLVALVGCFLVWGCFLLLLSSFSHVVCVTPPLPSNPTKQKKVRVHAQAVGAVEQDAGGAADALQGRDGRHAQVRPCLLLVVAFGWGCF